MTLAAVARRFARYPRRPSPRSDRPKLAIEPLEAREVPAHNLTIVSGTVDSNIQIFPPGNGATTVTIFTNGNDAALSIGTLEAQLQKNGVQHVIVTTDVKNGQPGTQAGNIVWDADTAGSLDFNGFGTGKTLTFQTVGGQNAAGDITLTGVQFESLGDQVNLEFDTHAVNGAVAFDPGAFNTVELTTDTIKDLTVNTGAGAFSYTDGGAPTGADVNGTIAITAGSVTLDLVNGLTAQGLISIAAGGSVTLANGTGLSAAGDLTLNATGPINATAAGLTADGGAIAVSGTAVALNQAQFTAPGGLSVTGSTWVSLSDGVFDVGGPVSFSGGTVSLASTTIPSSGTAGDVTIAGTTLTLANASIDSGGDIALTGTAVNANSVDLEADGNIAITGPVTAANGLDLIAGGDISFSSSIDGGADMTLTAGDSITVGGNIGSATGLNSLTILEGSMDVGNHNLKVAQVTIGQASATNEATLGMTGTLTGSVDVLATGNLAPGGVGTVGMLSVSGNVTFDGGDYAVDFGSSGADQLLTPGTVAINAGSQLGGLGTGQLTGGLAVVINAANRTGTFANAPAGVPVLVGTDVVTANYIGGQVILTPYSPPGGATATVKGTDVDGTLFKATITGGGQVVSGTDWQGDLFLVARNTTAASVLTVTTTVNGSSGVVSFPAGVLISGPLAAFTAPAVNIGTEFRASGAVALATFRDFLDTETSTGVEFGGTPAQLTSITARNLFGSVKTGSTLSSLKVARSLGAQQGVAFPHDTVVSAPAIGKVTARWAATDFHATGAIGTITITGDDHGDVSAASLGSLSAGTITGDVSATGVVSSVRATGAFNGKIVAGSLGKFQAGGGFADLHTTGAIGSITGKGEDGLGLELSASKVGAIKVDGPLSGDGIADGFDWNVNGGILSLTAGSIADVDVRAKYLGATLVKGSTLFGLSGNIADSSFTLTDNDGTSAQLGLKSLTAKGNIQGTLFDVQAGNVGAVTVGRFLDSQLYLDYTPNGDFGTGGSFGTKKYTLSSFKTTAVPTTDPNSPLYWAFQGSQVCADTIGTVTLSGLATDNSGTDFGIKIRSPGATVIVARADVTNDPDLPLNTALKTNNAVALAGDFFFMNI